MTSTPGPGRIGGRIAAVSGLGGIWRSAAAASCDLICEIVRPIWGGHAGLYDSRRAVPFQHHDPRGGQEVAPQMQGRAAMAWINVAPTLRPRSSQRELRHAEVLS
jgi:hypothetical protein